MMRIYRILLSSSALLQMVPSLPNPTFFSAFSSVPFVFAAAAVPAVELLSTIQVYHAQKTFLATL